MKLARPLALLALVLVTANAKENSIRGDRTLQEAPELLAQVKVGENESGTVNFLRTKDMLLIVSHADKREADDLNIRSFADEDLATFYKRISNGDEVPEKLAEAVALVTKRKKTKASETSAETGELMESSPDFEYDQEYGGNHRRLPACETSYYITGSYTSPIIYDTWAYSILEVYRGNVCHALDVKEGSTWNGEYSSCASAGSLSTIQAESATGSMASFRARTYDGSGDGYHWEYC